jgi:hypothetical protein
VFALVPYSNEQWDVWNVENNNTINVYRTSNKFNSFTKIEAYANIELTWKAHASYNGVGLPYSIVSCTDKEGTNDVVNGTANNDLNVFQVS